jgi:DNA-binding transcriptional MerR regulator
MIESNLPISEDQKELLSFLWDRKFTLDAIGITSKNIFDWSKQGLLLDPVKPKARRKYSIIEFIWLKLVVGLREFGLSLEAIRSVRITLLEVIPVMDVVDWYMDKENEESLKEMIGEKELLELQNGMEKMKSEIPEEEIRAYTNPDNFPEMKYISTLLSFLVVEAVWNKRDFHLFISSNGDCLAGDSQKSSVPFAEEMEFFNKPYINYPLRLLIGEFLKQDALISKEDVIHYRLLSKKELEILELLKSDNLVSLTVRLDKNQQIKLIETEENILVENVNGRITDFLMRNNYQEILCKSQDGNVTSLRRKTKHK